MPLQCEMKHEIAYFNMETVHICELHYSESLQINFFAIFFRRDRGGFDMPYLLM
jgi:hypothetical protein